MKSKVYQAGLKFLLYNAVKDLFHGEIFFKHALDHGMSANIIADKPITFTDVAEIKKYMQELVNRDIPINKKIIVKEEAVEYYKNKHEYEKAANALAVPNVSVSIYELDGKFNYFFSHYMPKSTGELKDFDIYFVKDNEIILIYPMNGNLDFTFREKIYKSFQDYESWLDKINVRYVCDLNKIISQGHAKDFIAKNDWAIDANMLKVCTRIIDEKKRIILIGGPSSSGKTTTSKKMSLFFESQGVKALPISMDDYFKNREETPLDENGEKDYECLQAVDTNMFENDVRRLLNGEEVKLPTYNFINGEKEWNNDPIKIDEQTVLVIEGLHALNPEVLNNLKDQTFRVYISPLTPISVDRHNYISTTDNRLLRRIIRDFRTRGRSVEASLATWDSVRRGEEKWIFPYTDQSDAIINTAYVYELGILKVYVEPLLQSVPIDSEFYYDARRLLYSLRTVYPITSEYVSNTNLLREFIGGSAFEEGE